MLYGARKNQRGVVLIMALLIVVLVTTVVVQVSWRFNLSMARNENRWHGAQARAYLEGGEQLARAILREDANEGSNVDHLGEMWAQPSQPMPTDEGWVGGQLEDAHGRFNLNTLRPPAAAIATGSGSGRAGGRQGGSTQQPLSEVDQYSAPQRRFIRFLQTIELENGPMDQTAALELVAAIVDWIDEDLNVTQGPFGEAGAEAGFYQSQDPPIYIANTEMSSVSELSLVKGVTPELYKKLEPFVVALPAKDFTMNINTVRPEVLRAFNLKGELYPLDEASWGALVEARAEMTEGIPSVDEFVNFLEAQGMIVDPAQFAKDGLGTASQYFIFTGETLVGEQVRRSKSLLFRNGGSVEVVRRTDGSF